MKKLSMKAARPRGKKHDNTITPPHAVVESLSIKSGDGATELVACQMRDGVGLWISDTAHPEHGISVYKIREEMAMGVRAQGGTTYGIALTVDADTGEGLLQLTTAGGETVLLTASEIIMAVKSINKLMCGGVNKTNRRRPRRRAEPVVAHDKVKVEKVEKPKAKRGRKPKVKDEDTVLA
jgi:hypothetical protein